MKPIFSQGDIKQYQFVVQQNDVAAFHGTVVHSVCSTFTLAREIEWTTRQFVLDMRDDDEEGVGTFLSIDHRSPAFVGDQVVIVAVVESITGNELICTYEAKVGSRLIAMGKTGQKILKKTRINEIFNKS